VFVLGNADFFTVADQLGEIGEGDVAALLRVVELSVRVASNDAHGRMMARPRLGGKEKALAPMAL